MINKTLFIFFGLFFGCVLCQDTKVDRVEPIKPTNSEIDQIIYNKQKLSVIKESKFDWKILKRIDSWSVLMGNSQVIGAEEFFRITESTHEQILLKNKLKLSRQKFVLAGISNVGGAAIAITPQTGHTGTYIGLVFVMIGQWLNYESYSMSVYPIISFESAKIIAEQYNKNLQSQKEILIPSQ